MYAVSSDTLNLCFLDEAWTRFLTSLFMWLRMCNGVAVMRRRSDSWLNATQILKVANFDKPQRTRILEREIQKGEHEKVQGGYGKYQGTVYGYRPSENIGLTRHCGLQVPGFLCTAVSLSVNNIIATTSFARSSSSTRTLKAPHLPPNMSPPLLRNNPAADSHSRNQNLPYLAEPPARLVNNKTRNRILKHSRTEALLMGHYHPRHQTSPLQAPELLPRSGATQITIPETPLDRHGPGNENLDGHAMVAVRLPTRAVRRNTPTRSWNTLSRTPTRSLLCSSHHPKISTRIWRLMTTVTLLYTGPQLWDGSG